MRINFWGESGGFQDKYVKSGGKTNLNMAVWKPETDVQL